MQTAAIELTAAPRGESAVELRSHHWREPLRADPVSRNRAFLDLCLDPRPDPARGTFVEHWPSHRLEPVGTVLFVPPRTVFRGSCGSGRQRSLSCFIDPALFDGHLEALRERALIECLGVNSLNVLNGLHRLLEEKRQPGFASSLIVEALLTTISVDLIRHLLDVQHTTGGSAGLAPWRLRLIEERVRSDEPLPTVSELAELCRLSRRHLARAFRQETGLMLKDRIRAAGVARARQMLAETRRPIKRIAADLGFSSTSSFSQAFYRDTGQRPSDVRGTGPSQPD